MGFLKKRKEAHAETQKRHRQTLIIVVVIIVLAILAVPAIRIGKNVYADWKVNHAIAESSKEESRAAASKAAEESAAVAASESKAADESAKESSRQAEAESLQKKIDESKAAESSKQAAEEASKAEETYYAGHKYEFVQSDDTWEQAKSAAEQAGGHLVTFTTEAEMDYVVEQIAAYNDAREKSVVVFWLGANDVGDNTYQWVTGEDVDLPENCWGKNEPSYTDENGADENYLMMYKVKGVWVMNDAGNDVSEYYSGRMGYIIEYDS